MENLSKSMRDNTKFVVKQDMKREDVSDQNESLYVLSGHNLFFSKGNYPKKRGLFLAQKSPYIDFYLKRDYRMYSSLGLHSKSAQAGGSQSNAEKLVSNSWQ